MTAARLPAGNSPDDDPSVTRDDVDRALAGRQIGPYQIIGLFGVGGMGEVYRARDTKLGREVALKILPAQFLADGRRLARFQLEARLLASLNHPNIATIYSCEEFDHSLAFAMELVPGRTLLERIADGPLSLDEAVPIAIQIADALAAAHDKGITHRDIKPANIKVTPDGRVKV